MKYLKTFESISISLEDKIIQWMDDNGITKIDLPPIEEESNTFTWVLKNLHKSDSINDSYEITANFSGTGSNEDCGLTGIWKIKTLKQILNYLESLTPEEIEDVRIKQEADKFNF